MRAGIGAAVAQHARLRLRLRSTSIWTARLDLVVANGHIDETVRNIRGNVGYAQPPHLFLNQGNGTFRDVAVERGRGLRAAARSAAASRTATSIATATSTC